MNTPRRKCFHQSVILEVGGTGTAAGSRRSPPTWNVDSGNDAKGNCNNVCFLIAPPVLTPWPGKPLEAVAPTPVKSAPYYAGAPARSGGQLLLESESNNVSARNIVTTTPPVRYLPPEPPAQPWHFAPLLELPGGALRHYVAGRILTADNFILAVGLSPMHYAVVAQAPAHSGIPAAMEQAVGFLYAHGARIVRVRLRCPMMWFANVNGDFEWQRCLTFFVRIFLATDPSEPPWIPPQIWPVVPLESIAAAGLRHWTQVKEILAGVEATDRDLLPKLGTSLTSMARRWEFYLARLIVLAERGGEYGRADRNAVAQCDHLFYWLVTRYEPGYQLLPATTQRLL